MCSTLKLFRFSFAEDDDDVNDEDDNEEDSDAAEEREEEQADGGPETRNAHGLSRMGVSKSLEGVLEPNLVAEDSYQVL